MKEGEEEREGRGEEGGEEGRRKRRIYSQLSVFQLARPFCDLGISRVFIRNFNPDKY